MTRKSGDLSSGKHSVSCTSLFLFDGLCGYGAFGCSRQRPDPVDDEPSDEDDDWR